MTYPVRELFERMEKTPVAINVATFVGHGNLRVDAMGEDDYRRHATAGGTREDAPAAWRTA